MAPAQPSPAPIYPSQPAPAGTSLTRASTPLFQPLRIRSLDFHNRIWVSPMCQYSCACHDTDKTLRGRLTSHHYTHYTSMIARGPGITIIEATHVSPEGRISPYCSGIWSDEHIPPIRAITQFAKARGQKVGLQLAHAGRKASTRPPWRLSRGLASQVAELDEGGWPDNVYGPTSDKWDEGYPTPKAMSVSDIRQVVEDFRKGAQRAVEAGVDVVEVHAAHGYLLGSFLSRTSNQRTDRYGGKFENRIRFLLEVIDAVRGQIPKEMPLLARMSSTEWVEDHNAWNDDETTALAIELQKHGVDLLTLSSGGNSSEQKVPRSIDYQTKIARHIRQRLRAEGCDLLIGAVGRVRESKQADELLSGDEPAADVILAGRQFLKEPSWVQRIAQELNVKMQWPVQYQLGRYGLETKL